MLLDGRRHPAPLTQPAEDSRTTPAAAKQGSAALQCVRHATHGALITPPLPNLLVCRASAPLATSGAVRGKRSACPTASFAAKRWRIAAAIQLRSPTGWGQPDDACCGEAKESSTSVRQTSHPEQPNHAPHTQTSWVVGRAPRLPPQEPFATKQQSAPASRNHPLPMPHSQHLDALTHCPLTH
jgi:hypothetical protein